ncbi:duodenase-1-like [Perca fluviatilis]|uniref:duodenase-1-like n=1 Tax=Perca fluviatilis TaxID=8168 RepID=UPI001962749F|nr:duodenase-1-like [Perca fluviatilis]
MHGLYKFLLFHVLAFLGQSELGSAIIDGKKAPEKSMLYMASVQGDHSRHVCGGFLVSDNFVVTAAHCRVERGKAKVVLGSHDLSRVEKTVKYIEKIFKHPSYKSDTQENDIMLLKLGGKDHWHFKGQPIQLPTSEININEKCSVAGWGFTESNRHTVDVLRVVNVSITNQDVCKKEWSGLPANVICGDKGLCNGDLGGPLVCDGTAVGVASFYKNEACDGPNVYTDISKSLTWINRVLGKKYC